jgi:choloylglycine hydrolase
MKSRFFVIAIIVASCCQIFANVTPAYACTGIRVMPKDGSVIFARTLEFAADLQSNIIVIPRDKEFVGTAPGDKPGIHWESKHGVVGTNAFGMPCIIDGLNESGLAIGLFYFPGYAKYQEAKAADIGKTLAPWELGVYLLSNCANVKEAVEAAQNIRVVDVVQKEMGYVPPCHYILNDASGKSIVLEYVGGELKVHDNPLGVITNAPTFDWHLTNLNNYVNLSISNVQSVEISGLKLPGFGQGSGMLGLPGDFTPPSRFVRAVAFSFSALPVETAQDGVLQVFHLLNQFDIPKGAARGVEHGDAVADYTLWTGASDMKSLRYYFRTFDNSRIRMIDLKKANFDAKEIKTIPMAGKEVIEDVTSQAK